MHEISGGKPFYVCAENQQQFPNNIFWKTCRAVFNMKHFIEKSLKINVEFHEDECITSHTHCHIQININEMFAVVYWIQNAVNKVHILSLLIRSMAELGSLVILFLQLLFIL